MCSQTINLSATCRLPSVSVLIQQACTTFHNSLLQTPRHRLLQEQKPEKRDFGEPIGVEAGDLQGYVGQPPFTSDKIYDTTPAGVVMGLAWTAMGGNTLYVEAAAVEASEGKGSLRTTGTGPWPP